LSFGEGDGEAGAIVAALAPGEAESFNLFHGGAFGMSCAAGGEEEAFLEQFDIFVGDDAFDGDVIFLGDFVAGVGDVLGEFAVVGEDDQAGGFGIESSDGEDAWVVGEANEFDDVGSALGVVAGGDDAAGFVEHDVNEPALDALADGLSVDGDAIVDGVDPCGEGSDGFAVDGDAALGDEEFAFTSRGDAGVGHGFLDSNATFLVGKFFRDVFAAFTHVSNSSPRKVEPR